MEGEGMRGLDSNTRTPLSKGAAAGLSIQDECFHSASQRRIEEEGQTETHTLQGNRVSLINICVVDDRICTGVFACGMNPLPEKPCRCGLGLYGLSIGGRPHGNDLSHWHRSKLLVSPPEQPHRVLSEFLPRLGPNLLLRASQVLSMSGPEESRH
ncbi:uncharacterized protein BJX67DRAFT_326737 [Aspergillus lucknowensis]|uniref:Uncharacterized protein n=1 Tax=Aspergillus lucknowensis TaxID=176173 RepID=A0ABR4L8D4_9EURO